MNNPLADVLPSKARKNLYAVVFVALIVWSAFEAAAGDWRVFIGLLLTALVPLLAASNTPTSGNDATS